MVDTITDRATDFTNRDFESWILELRSRALAAFPGWTDYNTPNFGNIILEMMAHTLDVISFTQDQQFLEMFISYATLRRSMINLGKNVGFSLPGAVQATVDLEISIADGDPRVNDITIPKGTVVRTSILEEEVEFDLTADVTIAAGDTQETGAAENARERSESFVADGSADQSFVGGFIPYIDSSAVVTIAGDSYTEVSNFLSSGPSDKHFIVSIDEDNRPTLTFGDGVNGDKPTGAATVVYKTGGGSSGNVDANTLTVFKDGNRFPSASGEQVQLSVRNPLAVSDGVDRMSIEEARIAIPESLQTVGNRSVTTEDFEINARRVRGVARSMMLTADDDSSIPENEGLLFIVPLGGGLPSTALKDAVYDLITTTYPPTLTFDFAMEDPTLKIVSITATVYPNTGVSDADARAAIEDAVDAFFALRNEDGTINEQIDFGYKIRSEKMPSGTLVAEIPFSDLFNAVRDAVLPNGNLALRKVDEDTFTPTGDVEILDREFPIAGSITLTNGDSAASI